MEKQINWILNIVQDMNNKMSELTKITAGHSMALKIIGTSLALIASGLIALAVRILGVK